MNASIFAAGTSFAVGRHIAAGLLAALAFGSTASGADYDSDAAPWIIDGSQYLPDPSYNGGLYTVDAFAGNEGFSYRAKKLVHLDNGDVVVAAIVPPFGGGSANTINLGLVRYNASGQRVAWSNPTPSFAFFGNQYIVYPNTSDGTVDDSVSDVKDMQRIGNRIFVLIDHPFDGTGDMDSRVVVFDTDGQFLATDPIVATSLPEHAGGITVYSNLQFPETLGLAYAGTTIATDGSTRPTFRRFTINADSTLTAETAPVYVTAGDVCSSTHNCQLRGIAAGGMSGSSPSRFYLAGGYQYQGDDWDYLVFAVLSDGSAATSFSDDGARIHFFDVGGSGRDIANAISVTRGGVGSTDQIYLSGEVAQDCEPGVGITKFDGSGESQLGFGSGGDVVVGGSAETNPSTCSLDFAFGSARADIGLASALDGGKLAVAGLNIYGPGLLCTAGNPCPEDNVDGELIVVDAETGALDAFRGYAFSDTAGGPRSRHSGLWGIVPSGSGSFTVAGDVRFFQSAPGEPAGAMQVATLRLGSASDVIFADGFD